MTNIMRGVFRAGERVQLTGPKGRLNTITLRAGAVFGTHRGDIKHDDIIGKPDGSVITNQAGVEYLALRPLLTDFVLSMPRGAAIVYPKDAASIVTMGDIFPGARVVEAGVGSGALSMYLLRAVGESGSLTSFERRAEFAEIAKANVETQFGYVPDNWSIQLGSLQDELLTVVEPGSIDRVVLDMLAPWECIDAVSEALAPGGVLICYVATVTQLSRVAEEIKATGNYADPEAFESLVRGWHLQGLAVRPEHRMGGHTGFLLTARRLAPGAVLPSFSRRAKPEFSDEDLSVWNPEHLGERSVSEKRLRKSVRSAQSAATAKSQVSDSSEE
ncbi:MAG: tRNA (adenine-N1)-methyltransferase [Actinobacteria bacterium]|jgi:tRNA (adenine57-N1/adenine58-N1)-methyltransferase|nr:tRNA (adenine-N1)-methyltransferase [Microbacteriaceae bacterium]NBX94630.1 tRNA (adenine-N1)-methyltransferase [Actinomycetota bacterium]